MRWTVIGLAALATAACSRAPEVQQTSASLASIDAPAPLAAASDPAKPQPITVSLPQIAYSYRYVFRLPDAAIAKAQEAHVALCDRLGPARCQVQSLDSGGGEGEASSASLKLRVAAPIARAFGRDLQRAVAQARGRAVSNSISAEDVSKSLSDTQARLAQRTLLVERLTAILRNRQGKVAELVEAERSVAAAQEEIDQARAWLAELRGRVALSSVEIRYQTIAAPVGPARSGIADAVAQSASVFVAGLTTMIAVAILLAPWAALALGGWWAWRRLRPRRDRIDPIDG